MGISTTPNRPRVPFPSGGIQVNFCKNPLCANFGVPAIDRPKFSRSIDGQPRYRLLGGGGKLHPSLGCELCKEAPPVKSNKAVREEYDRMMRQLVLPKEPYCPNTACCNHTLGVLSHASCYCAYGSTKGGSRRFKCKECGKVFSQPQRASLRQRDSSKNELIFKLLVNKSPMRRICEVANINAETLYQRIGFFAEQCRLFSAQQEARLLTIDIPRLNIAVDRQEYIVNWSNSRDKRNVVLKGIASADLSSGYVFGMHSNFDAEVDRKRTEIEASANGDKNLPGAYREHARVWLEADYTDAVRTRHKIKKQKALQKRNASGDAGSRLHEEVAKTYVEAEARVAVDVAADQNIDTRLPSRGMLVHSEYTLYGHFFYLEQLFRRVGKVRFYLDQEAGIRTACLAAFHQRVKDRTSDAFFVRIDKSMTIHERNTATAEAKKQIEALHAANPNLDKSQLELKMIKDRIASMQSIGKWSDKWMSHPFPNGGEPDKAVCYLTDYGDYAPDQLARLYQRASLHAVDRYFMLLRRMISVFERPIQTATSQFRTWYGYSPYNPEIPEKLHTIFRTYFNYVKVGDKDKRTPAMRLGLADGPVDITEILDFIPNAMTG